jgi:hypothetical protein
MLRVGSRVWGIFAAQHFRGWVDQLKVAKGRVFADMQGLHSSNTLVTA